MVRLGKSYPHKLSPGVPRLGRLAHYLAHSLSIHGGAVRSDPERGAVRIARSVIGSVLSAVLCFIPTVSIASSNEVIKYQTFAGSLLTPLEFSSALTLWTKESNWNPKAKNGSHYGICQGRSNYLIKANYKQQIRWCISYAINRYGSVTKALEHWKVHKWH